MIICTECRMVLQSPAYCADLDVWPGHHVLSSGFGTGYAGWYSRVGWRCANPQYRELPAIGTVWPDHGECASPPPATGVGELESLVKAARSLAAAARALRDAAGYDATRASDYDRVSDSVWDLAKSIAHTEVCT